MIEIIRVRDPEAFLLPGFQALMLECMESNKLVREPEKAVLELAACVHRDDIGLFLAGKKNDWKGVLLAQWGKSALTPGCVALHIYSKGGPKVKDALMQACVDYARLGGYDRIIGMFQDTHKKALMRMFNALGEPVDAGQMIVFDLNESLL